MELYTLIDFYDNLLKPVMYEIGQLWVEGIGRIDIILDDLVPRKIVQKKIVLCSRELIVNR